VNIPKRLFKPLVTRYTGCDEYGGVFVHIETQNRWKFDAALAGTYLFAGVDEAGRGCLAGPVVAAAVIPPNPLPATWSNIHDSKQISAKKRQALFEIIQESALHIGVGTATVQEIDDLNILHASRVAMGRAIRKLGIVPDIALIDGPYCAIFEDEGVASLPVIDGDARCISVAAASIIAKVTRDSMMETFSHTYPEYGFEHHVGYGTKEHFSALEQFGPTPLHRKSFAPVRKHAQTNLGI
jgi:ribonuclease HII